MAAKGGFILDGDDRVYFESNAMIVSVSTTDPVIRVWKGDTAASDAESGDFVVGTASTGTAWGTTNAPHDNTSFFIPSGYSIQLSDTSNRSWVNYKYLGSYGAQ